MRALVEGGACLEGSVDISGSKNAALPIVAATLLTRSTVVLTNVPRVKDIHVLLAIMAQLGTQVEWISNSTLRLSTPSIVSSTPDPTKVGKLRAGFWVISPLLARNGEAHVSLPGGCSIGSRPVDLHLHALQRLGAEVSMTERYVHARLPRHGFVGAEIEFPSISVGATHTAIMAAACADGQTRILNAACEPEIGALIDFLNQCGASITKPAQTEILIDGVPTLGGGIHRIIPDRIEAGTYAVAVVNVGGTIRLKGISAESLTNVFDLLGQTDAVIAEQDGDVIVSHSGDRIRSFDIETGPFPNFSTDFQPQFMALLSGADGRCVVRETVFENRFQHTAELAKMGANIMVDGDRAIIDGVPNLNSAAITGTDLRATAGLIIAALRASGTSEVRGLDHLDRGYSGFVEKLAACGAKIHRSAPMSL